MSIFRRFLRHSGGSALPVVGIGILAMVGAAGSAVDMGRAQMVQSKLSSALDAAGLAAASTLNTTNLNTETSKYVNANFPANYLGSTVTSATATPNGDNTIITLAATASMPTTFMKLFGVNTINVRADGEITRQSKGLELVLVMDVTGSMDNSAGGGVSKISAARSAATTLVNILYGDKTTIPNLWIGMVPFSQGVNIGSARTAWTSDANDWKGVAWAGCVDAREASGRDITDDPPSVALFPRYFWPDDSNNDWLRNNGNVRSGIGDTLGPNKYCQQPITPLTGSKATITSAISALDTGGNTHIGLGAVWGWRLLSPRWRTLWGGEMNTNNLPLDYNSALMNKVMVLMTDGDNTIDNSSRGAYWYLSDGKLGSTNQSTAETKLDTNLSAVCTSMKANNIIIYTIALGTNISSSSQTMLRNCATKPEYYFNSPTTSALQTAFQQIGDALSNLRISK